MNAKPIMTTKPFLPFTRPSIDAESIAAVADVFRSGQLASGPKVQAFEAALAAYLGAGRHVRVMTSATAGLEMALEVAGIGPGDEVIVPAMSFAASANVIARLRAKPVFVDIDLHSRNIDLSRVRGRHHRRGPAPSCPCISPGWRWTWTSCMRSRADHGLRVIEDAAHAIGTRHRGRPIGSFGDLVVFSFHPNKNMTTIEGGAIATADARAAELVEQYRFHGIKRNAEGEIDVMFPGAKSNLTRRRRADRHRSAAAASTASTRAAWSSPARYFEELEGLRRGGAARSAAIGPCWHMFQVLIDFDARRA